MPFTEFIEREGGRAWISRKTSLHASHSVLSGSPWLWQRLPPSLSALLSLRIILTVHSNHTNRRSCLYWMTFQTLMCPSAWKPELSLTPLWAEDHTEFICTQRVWGVRAGIDIAFKENRWVGQHSSAGVSAVLTVQHHTPEEVALNGFDCYDTIKEVI